MGTTRRDDDWHFTPKHPNLTQTEKDTFNKYLQKSKELIITKKQLELERKATIKNNAKIENLSNQASALENEITNLISTANLKTIIEDHIAEKYITAFLEKLNEFRQSLQDKILKALQAKDVVIKTVEGEAFSLDELYPSLDKYFQSPIDDSERKNMKRYHNQIAALDEIGDEIEKAHPDDDALPSAIMKTIQEAYTLQRQKGLADYGSAFNMITQLWSTKQKTVKNLEEILENYSKEIYLPESVPSLTPEAKR